MTAKAKKLWWAFIAFAALYFGGHVVVAIIRRTL